MLQKTNASEWLELLIWENTSSLLVRMGNRITGHAASTGASLQNYKLI